MLYLNPLNTSSILTETEHPVSPLMVQAKESGPVEGFAEVLSRALGGVNQLNLRSDALMQQMVVDSSSVDIHEVTHALSQAEMALAMTKAVSDRVIHAYRELTNLR